MQNTTIAERIKTLPPEILNYIKELEANYKYLQFENTVLEEKLKLLTYKRFARSAEQLLADKNQQNLFDEENAENNQGRESKETNTQEITEVKSHKRRKNPNAGRKPLDPKLPRVKRIIDLDESQKTCACEHELSKIGEEISEKLHIIPMQIYVEQIIRYKYACRHCEGTSDEDSPTVKIAPVESTIIPKGIATAGLLSCIFTQKFEDHLPYYRQEKQFERLGVTLSRQDMTNWQQHVYKKVKPLLALMKEVIKIGPVIRMDETPVQVLREQGRCDISESRMWLSLGGLPDKPVVMYQYRKTRAAEHAKEMLQGFSGYLQTDGYIGYDSALKGNDKIIHVSCFAHVRRYFFEAAKISNKATTAKDGIEHIKKLYIIETQLRKKYAQEEKDDEQRCNKKRKDFLTERKTLCQPVLAEFNAWLKILEKEVPPKTLLGEAVGYALGQWEKLVKYLDSPYLTPDNNAAENAIRPFVMGRKAWLFCQSPDGAESSCGMYSLIQTAKLNGVNTYQYLKTLFEKAPDASSTEDWENLLPWNIFKF